MEKKLLGICIFLLCIVTIIPTATSQPHRTVSMMTSSSTSDILSSTYRFLTQKIPVSNDFFLDEFGCAVSLDGNYALIGAENDNVYGLHSGSAVIYTRIGSTWVPQQRLFASDEGKNYLFGHTVSLDNNTAVISAFGVGSVYIFTRIDTTWTQQAKLSVPDGALDFGFSVAISGDTALIGTSDVVYVFIRAGVTWAQQAKLVPSDGGGNAFGWSVSLDRDTALIGAILDEDHGIGSGAAYIFTRTGTTWTQQAKLLASDGAADDYFGCSVSIDGDTALIGADGNDDIGQNCGAAYIFTRTNTTWTLQAKLHGELFEFFGESVSLDGDTALIGTLNFGSMYIYIRSGNYWVEQATLLTPDEPVEDYQNCFVAIDGDTAIIGIEGKFGRGAAYVFTRSGTIWLQEVQMHAIYNALLFGRITQRNDTGNFITFQPDTTVFSIDVRMGQIKVLLSDTQVFVSTQNKIGYIGSRFIFGMFEGTFLL